MPKVIKSDEYDDIHSEEREMISERIKKIRALHNLTQQELADILDYSVDKIKKIESKQKDLDIELALKINNHYDISLDYLYGISDYLNLEEYLIDDLIENVLEPKIFEKKYMSKNMVQVSVDTLQIKTKKGFFPVLLRLIKLNEQLKSKKISFDEYNDKRDSLLKEYEYSINKTNTDYEYHIIMPKILIDEKNMFQLKEIAEDMQKAYDLQFKDTKKED